MRTLTTQNFIDRSHAVHGYKYDCSKSIYTKMKTKTLVGCPTHGFFHQTPWHHLHGSGCPSCSRAFHSKMQFSNKKSFITKSTRIHENKYDYNKVNYVRANLKVIIRCKLHGYFKQSPNSHLSGHGCPRCQILLMKNNYTRKQPDFVQLARKKHENYYDYSNTIYKNSYTKIKIICPKHGTFKQTPNSHLNGQGCPKCSHVISSPETEFLNIMKISERSFRIPEWKSKPVDGYDPTTKTIYEFLGDYWHGNPKIYDPNKLHPKRKITYKTLYLETFETFKKLKSLGYIVCYIWESDWKKWNGIGIPPIKTYLENTETII